MTLQNGMVQGRKAYLWADTAFWDSQTGELVCYDTKAFQGLYWPFCGVMSCYGSNPHDLARAIGHAEPSNLSDLLTKARNALMGYCSTGSTGRLLLASYEDGPHLHLIASDGAGIAAPFEPVEVDYYVSSGNDTLPYKMAVKRGFTRKRMSKVIDAQIRQPYGGGGISAELGEKVWFGGNVVRLEVSDRGVASEVERAV
jgi:hypothetical protein|tara:strand:+ start:553 stop:1149 length:597 start_codon:yes stop_codon:yes gene_type:complete